jgi:hypothetical protein
VWERKLRSGSCAIIDKQQVTELPGKPNLPVISFTSPAEWDAWLTENHARSTGVWLQIFKKDSSRKTISYAKENHSMRRPIWSNSRRAGRKVYGRKSTSAMSLGCTN